MRFIKTALTNKASVKAAQYRLAGAKHSIRIAQSDFYPQLSLGGSLGTRYYSTIDRNFSQQLRDNFSKYVGFSLSVPLFNRFATVTVCVRHDYSKRTTPCNWTTPRKCFIRKFSKPGTLHWLPSKYTSSSTAANASMESFKLMSEKYDNGKANAVEYNEAKQNLMKAQSDELQAKYEYLFRTKILDFYKGIPIEQLF